MFFFLFFSTVNGVESGHQAPGFCSLSPPKASSQGGDDPLADGDDLSKKALAERIATQFDSIELRSINWRSDCFPDFGFVSDSSIQAIYFTPRSTDDQVAHCPANLSCFKDFGRWWFEYGIGLMLNGGVVAVDGVDLGDFG
ncbi:hypothetical protein LWI29_001014 [Acer saccharum]|uniref:Uncharacterized protein n=1 Tax=Acer saccharum TaxID=4024 RepID=A0AA39VF78_ACESA|nr:hypothetical protein LWI29_001014 [Acer saccharum]